MSLKFWLPLDGNIRNEGGSSETSTAYGGVAATNGGKVTYQCYNFDGADDAILVPFNKCITGNEWSISIWFYKSEYGAKSWETIFGGPSFEIESKYSSTNSPSLYAYSWGGKSASYSLNKWNHLAVTRTATETKWYLNGELQFTGTAGSISTGSYYLGAWNSSTGQNFKGKLNDFRLYNHCLSIQEVKELSQGLVLHFPLRDRIITSSKFGNANTIEFDCSGFNYNGVRHGSLSTSTSKIPRQSSATYFASGAYIGLDKIPIHNSSTDLTFSFWMSTSTPSNTMALWNGRTAAGGSLSIFALGGKFRFDDGAQHTIEYSIPLNKYEHYVFTRTNSTIKFYVNGVLKDSKSSTALSGMGTKATIGASSVNTSTGSGNNFVGYLVDYRIYATALSDNDIKTLYNTAAKIDKVGNFYTYELIETSTSATNIFRNGAQRAEAFIEASGTTKIYKDATIKAVSFNEI